MHGFYTLYHVPGVRSERGIGRAIWFHNQVGFIGGF